MPLLMKFYGGSIQEWLTIPQSILAIFLRKLPSLRAQQRLHEYSVATFPYMTSEYRGEVLRALYADLDAGDMKSAAPVSKEVHAAQLHAMGIQIQFVKSEEQPT